MKYYDPPYNFTRHGCVGCPLATKSQMRIEFKAFPQYATNLMKAIKRFQEAKPHTFWGKEFDNEYEAFYYYINDLTLQDFKFMKTASLFGSNFKQVVNNYLNVN